LKISRQQIAAYLSVRISGGSSAEPSREGRDLDLGELELGAAQVGVYEASTHRQTMTGLVPILQAAEEGKDQVALSGVERSSDHSLG
jgi:hypothetical protein